MSSEWPDAQLSNIQKTLQNSWQIPYISLFARIFCDAFQLFDFHQEELEDALLSDNPNEIHPFLQELLISLVSGLTRLHVNSSNMFLMLANVLKRCNLNIVSSPPSTLLMTISDDTISTANWQEMGIFEKVTVLRALCDARLDRQDLEQVTENMAADSLRFEPFGEDSRGNKYWYFGDTRLYCDLYNKSTETPTWECMCRTLEEWNEFIEKFSKTCSRKKANSKDRQLLDRLVALNSELPDIYARKERDRQRRWTSYEPKRSSNRLEAKRQQRLALEEITLEQKARHDKFLEFKRRQEEIIIKEKERLERYERVKRREERADRIRRRAGAGSGSGNIDAAELSENSNMSSTWNEDSAHIMDTTDIHQKVLNLLRTNENSWPFLEPVTEELAPNYFSIIESPIDLSMIQKKINNKAYVNNSTEFIQDIELMIANCEQYNGKRSILGRIANRLLRYFKDCWSECQPNHQQFEDEDDQISSTKDNSTKRRLNDAPTTTLTRDRNNNTRPRKNYRQLAGLSDDDDEHHESEYVPTPSKRARHSTTSAPVYITLEPNSPAFIVYHDHSYFIRHESNNPLSINFSESSQRRKTTTTPTNRSLNSQLNDVPEKKPNSISTTTSTMQAISPISSTTKSLSSIQVINKLMLEHKDKINNLSTASSVQITTSDTNNFDWNAILRSLLTKQVTSQMNVGSKIENNSPMNSASLASMMSSTSSEKVESKNTTQQST